MVIVLSQLFWFQAADFSKKKAESGQTAGAENQDEAHISLASSSLPSTNNVVVEQEFSFIHEILFEEETTSETTKTIASAVGEFFQTLFRVIIAPNAP